ncbi:hypothetical protein ACCO45_005641 [Purpureocillium lilacinum]|uniref:Uncharacterized protein n=1 Tax=Purpureocillium lilacinum TaxID=33203 RepID=A0ACC4DYC6_PURLI
MRFFFIMRRFPLRRPSPVLETTSAGSLSSDFSSACGSATASGSGSTASCISSSLCSLFSSFSSSSSSSIIRLNSSSRSFLVLLVVVASAEVSFAVGMSASSASPSSDNAIAASSSFSGAGFGLLGGFEAALAKDCMMPPGPPRFDVGPALLLELDDGVGIFDAVSEGSLFNLAGGAGAGFGVDEFVGAGFCTGSALAGFCAVRAEVTGRPLDRACEGSDSE